MNARIIALILFCVVYGYDYDYDNNYWGDEGGGGFNEGEEDFNPIGNNAESFYEAEDLSIYEDKDYRKRVDGKNLPEELEDEKKLAKVRKQWKPKLWEFKWSWKDPWAERPKGELNWNQADYANLLNNIRHDKVKENPAKDGQHGDRPPGEQGGQGGHGEHEQGVHGGHVVHGVHEGPGVHGVHEGAGVHGAHDAHAKHGGTGEHAELLRFKRSLRSKRNAKVTRKEYHTLTDDERERFHKAIQKMKALGAYDTIGMRHRIKDAPGAHEGCAFLLWHRMYILSFEVALQLIDGTVSLPYWDSSLEGRLGRKFKYSCLFDKHHLGGWSGPVTDGAFANFTSYKGCTKTGPILTRKHGTKNALYTSGDFIRYDKFKKFRDIGETSRFEDDHGYIHLTVGGHMQNLNCAPVDPIFFLHHGFVDYLFFRFRRNQVGNKTTDYVAKPKKHHGYNDPMLPFSGTWNRDGLKDIPSVTYQDSPSMTVCKKHKECQSSMLWCDRERCTAKIKEGARCVRNKHTSCFCPTGQTPSCVKGKKPWWWKTCKCEQT